MRDPQNIQAAEASGVDLMGFIFYEGSSRFVGAMDPVMTTKVTRVGVFVNEEIERIQHIARQWQLDIIQLHGDESPSFCQQIKNLGLRVVKAFAIDETFDFAQLRDYGDHVDYFLFDTKGTNYGGNGVLFDWALLSKYNEDVPFWLSGGIHPGVTEAISALDLPGLVAVDVNSGFEEEPGYKNIKKLKRFTDEIHH